MPVVILCWRDHNGRGTPQQQISRAIGRRTRTYTSRAIGAVILIVFSGLPGTGKSTLGRALAHNLGAQYVRIDTIEQALLDEGGGPLVALGASYRVANAIAEDNLGLGRTVIADCVNPIAVTRQAWHEVAKRSGAMVVDVVVVWSVPTRRSIAAESRFAPQGRAPQIGTKS